jgi:hypothetical protein
MKTIATSLLSIVLLAAAASAQNASPTFYAESIKKGPTHIAEDKFEIKLDPNNALYKQQLRDSSGNERYELTITPKIPLGEGTNKILSWQVSLVDPRHNIYGNLLQFDRELSEDPKDNLYWLNPRANAPVAIRARRIIKVDSFYVVVQVKDFRFSPPYSPYLDLMIVQMELTNRDPRTPTP